MQSSTRPYLRLSLTATLLSLCLAAFILWCSLPLGHAQNAPQDADNKPVAGARSSALPGTNATAAAADGTNAAPHGASDTNAAAVAVVPADGITNSAEGTNAPEKKLPTDLIQLSFQNAQIDQIIQWLSENTGKSVVKHPQAHCQVTIVGTKKVTRQEAVTLIYRALGMEGYTAIESSKSILIVPATDEPKLSPQFLGATNADTPGGRERLFKVFSLQHVQAADLTEKVKSVLSDKATVFTDDRANLMIITDYNDNLASAGALIAALDVEKADDVTVRVLPLKNVNAQDLARQIAPLYQKLTGKGTKEIIEVSASTTANSLLVLSSAMNFKEIEKFVAALDTADAQEKIMRTFVLKNADAQDVAKQLQDLGKDQNNSDGPYRVFYYGGNPNGNDAKKISIVPDRRRNSILIQAPPSTMESLAKTIAALDAPITDNNLAPKIVALKFVNAGDIEDVLNELFLKKTSQRSYYDDIFGAPPETPDRDVGRLYGKVRITSEAASNSLIVTANSEENLEAVMQVIRQLDVPSEAGDTTFHVTLRFAKAPKIANSVNILFAKGGAPALRPANPPNPNGANPPPQQQGQQPGATPTDDFALEQEAKDDAYYPWLGGQPDATRNGSSDTRGSRPVSDLVGRVRVVPDERSNSLLVSANVHFFPQVMKLIEEMDVPTAQVMIEARLVEISSDYMDQLGVRYSPDGSKVFTQNDYDNSLLVHGGGNFQKGYGSVQTVNGPSTTGADSAGNVANALTQLRTGVLDSTISMDFLVQFLREHTDTTVLAEPQIKIGDNETGKLFVGTKVPIQSGNVAPPTGGSTQSFTYENVGVTLEVEPHINDSGDVSLKVRTESSIVDPNQSLFGNPFIDTRNFRTELTAKTGQTLVLGGIRQRQLANTIRKTPGLSSIPILKWAFTNKNKSGQRVELLVFLRPKVVRTPQEARELLEEGNKKMPLIQKFQETDPSYQKDPPAPPDQGAP